MVGREYQAVRLREVYGKLEFSVAGKLVETYRESEVETQERLGSFLKTAIRLQIASIIAIPVALFEVSL